jgi:glutamine amidotransferase
MNLGVIDYQASNLGSLSSALRKIELNHYVSSNTKEFRGADLIILPGVGSFFSGMNNLIASGLDHVLKEHAERGKPILGICLGMHLLATIGYEGGTVNGLNLIPGKVLRIKPTLESRVPHMGWDEIQSGESKRYVYFAHSYFFSPLESQETKIVSTFQSGYEIYPAQIQAHNVSGIQFHPEKSGETGLQILQDTIQKLMAGNQ